jgi:hypothetical protein
VRRAHALRDGLLGEAAAGALRRDMPVPLIRQYLIGALNWPVDWYRPGRGPFEPLAAQITALVLHGRVVPEDDEAPARPASRQPRHRATTARRGEGMR